MSRPAAVVLVVLVALAGGSGCMAPAPAPEVFLAPGYAGAPAVERVLVLPLNIDTHIPDFLIDAADELRHGITHQFREEGREVTPIGLAATYRVWQDVSQGAPGEDAAALTARRLAQENAVEAVVVADLLMVEAGFLPKQRVGWDGHVEPIEIVMEGKGGPRRGSLKMTGQSRALSLQVRVFDPAGALVFEKRVPLELVDRIRMRGRLYWVEMRPDLCSDSEVLDRTIRKALVPFLQTVPTQAEAPPAA